MPINNDLERRMKKYYEQVPKIKLMRRTPVIIRIDGRAFHSFTKNFVRPFDDVLIKSMQDTMKYLCENIQGCVLGYHQSDEISLVLVDYQRLNSSAWFDYEVQKICSIAASMATMIFNKRFEENTYEYDVHLPNPVEKETRDRILMYHCKAVDKGAQFDARCFNIPKEEVTNYIYLRQLDAMRNSIQMVGQAHFTHKELQNKSCNQIQDMLMTQKEIDWNDLPIYQKRGSCCVKNKIIINFNPDEHVGIAMLRDVQVSENKWIVDKEIPVFKGKDREYIDKLIYVGE